MSAQIDEFPNTEKRLLKVLSNSDRRNGNRILIKARRLINAGSIHFKRIGNSCAIDMLKGTAILRAHSHLIRSV